VKKKAKRAASLTYSMLSRKTSHSLSANGNGDDETSVVRPSVDNQEIKAPREKKKNVMVRRGFLLSPVSLKKRRKREKEKRWLPMTVVGNALKAPLPPCNRERMSVRGESPNSARHPSLSILAGECVKRQRGEQEGREV
jgi:hypothetical protein